MAAVQGLTTNLTGPGDPLALPGMQVSPEFFALLRISPALGRSFTREEDQPGREHVAILRFGLWQSRFGADTGVLGRKIVANGVMPRDFTLPKYTADLWTPLPIIRSREWESGRYLQVIARLKHGITLEQAREDLHSVARQSAIERPRFLTPSGAPKQFRC